MSISDVLLKTLMKPRPLTSEQLSVIAAQVPPVDISGKVDKILGKSLSTNDYTNEDKQKVITGTGGGSVGNIDGGKADTNYGGQGIMDGGTA
jgi:hypothetical protein